MKIALIGASGNAGQRILKELSDRGHKVTAIARHPENIPALPGVTSVAGDLYNPEALAGLVKGYDVVISSVRFVNSDPKLLIEAMKHASVGRYIVVGGAASLEVAPGALLIDAPAFPEAARPEATAGKVFLDLLRAEPKLNWTFLSPSALFRAGERTGQFRLGKEQLLSNENGSSISYEDYAIALVDEVETPRHERQRFTVGY